MAVDFLPGYSPARSITVSADQGVEWTEMNDGTLYGREVTSSGFSSMPINLVYLTQAEMQEVTSFLYNNRAELIRWDIDGIGYEGNVRGPVSRTMVGNRYNVNFSYYAKVVSSPDKAAILSQPQNVAAVVDGGSAVFIVVASGDDVTYRWQVSIGGVWTDVSGARYSGESTSTLGITGVSDADVDVGYRCVVSGQSNTLFSDSASILAIAERALLNWDGVDGRASMSAWSMVGFGDGFSGLIVADTPGTGDQYIFANSDASVGLYIADSTGALTFDYVDSDGTTSRSIVGPVLSADTEYSYQIVFEPSRVVLTVGITEFIGSDAPELGGSQYFSSDHTPANYFDGNSRNLGFNNATTLQAGNFVEHDGTLFATLPVIPLVNATITFDYKHATGDQTLVDGSAEILTVASNQFVSGSNVSSLTVDGEAYSSATLVADQHYSIVIAVDGGTLDTLGPLVSGGLFGPVTVVSNGLTYPFNMSGDSDAISNLNPSTRNLRQFTNSQLYSNDLTV